MTSEPHTTIRSVTDSPDVDTLVETARDAFLSYSVGYANTDMARMREQEARLDAALSDLAARVRELEADENFVRAEALQAELGSMEDRAEAAEADRNEYIDIAERLDGERDRLARRVAELEQERDAWLVLLGRKSELAGDGGGA